MSPVPTASPRGGTPWTKSPMKRGIRIPRGSRERGAPAARGGGFFFLGRGLERAGQACYRLSGPNEEHQARLIQSMQLAAKANPPGSHN